MNEVINEPWALASLSMSILGFLLFMSIVANITLAMRLSRTEFSNELLTIRNEEYKEREVEWQELAESQALDIHAMQSQLDAAPPTRDDVDEITELYGETVYDVAPQNGAPRNLFSNN